MGVQQLMKADSRTIAVCQPAFKMRAGDLGREDGRLQALHATGLLDSDQETEFDELVQLAAAICGTPMGAMSLLDAQRQWFKASVGIPVKETPREIAICDHTIRGNTLFVVGDMLADSRFCSHPMVAGAPGIQFYAGMPLLSADGYALGTLCVLDTEPRILTEQQSSALQVLARQVMGRIGFRSQQKALAEVMAEKDRIAAGLAEYQSELEAANDRLRSLVVTDELTGLKNRRAFDERLTFEFSMARRKRRDLSVVLLDADDFKLVNDRYGHPAGDDVLRRLGKALRETVRETDLAARYGGEEFAVILPETGAKEATRWCMRLQRALGAVPWENSRVTVSMGLASKGPEHLSGGEMVQAADRALYQAKDSGKNRLVAASALERAPTVEAEQLVRG